MKGCNGFGIDKFTTEEVGGLVTGLTLGKIFFWRGEWMKVTSMEPFECHCFWDL